MHTVKKHIIIIAGLAVTLGLAGCAGGSSNTPAAEVESTPTQTKQTPVENIDKTWTFDYQGATGTFKLADNEGDADVAAVDTARATVDGEKVTLVPVTIDNTNGTESLNMYGLTIITKDGQQVDSMPLDDAFTSWMDSAGDDVDKYNALVDVSNKYTMFDLQPGAKGTAVVAFKEPVTSAWRVTVMPSGGSENVEASAS
jgi:ABC-type glycerol-3-phosphate transport system substrate-binding protein